LSKNDDVAKKRSNIILFFIFNVINVIFFTCSSQTGLIKNSADRPTPYSINVPFFPDSLNIPSDNPMTVEGIELGRYLFYDGRLSGNTNKEQLMTCASCHLQKHSFECGIDHPLYKGGRPHGLTGEETPHVMLPLINLAWINEGYLWNGMISNSNNILGDEKLGVPHEQIYNHKNIESLVWMSIVSPHEICGNIEKTVYTIQNIPMYPPMFKKAFGSDVITMDRINKAIAQFVRSLVSCNSKFDRFMDGKENLTESEMSGLYLFTTERGDCFHCHGSPALPLWTTNSFMNNAKDINFNEPEDRSFVTKNPKDKGKYRVPTLRNIALTAPYMHDGRYKTLDEVLEFYNSGLKRSPYVDPLMINMNHGGMHLLEKDLADLKAFLITLTDSSFITNPKYSNPMPQNEYFIK
jgi:cytochrome c peroxidase